MKSKQITYNGVRGKDHDSPSPFNSSYITKVSTVSVIADLVNSDWKHSMYWDLEDREKLLIQINDSLDIEVGYAMKRIAQLQKAKELLSTIIEDSA